MISHRFDERRDLVVPGDYTQTLAFSVDHFLKIAKSAIQKHGCFFVALSGGSTPKAIFERLSSSSHAQEPIWSKVFLFWSDERATPPTDPESNYKMAMDAGFSKLPIPPAQIFRMHAETEIEKNALEYEKTIQKTLNGRSFDLMMLGMGEDGHTASLFPHTRGLHEQKRWVIANEIPQKKCWRMTLTFPCINQSENIAIYVLGASKRYMAAKVLLSPDQFEELPVQKVGTKEHKALWILDEAAAADILRR